MVRAGRPPQDPARQLERAHRILDAAAELVLRWGYDKTTIDDVSKRAGVAKGTIYLHWKTRDDLFAALLRRERVRMLADVRGRGPATLSELYGEFARALLGRPLLSAFMQGDSEVLGKFARQKQQAGRPPVTGEALDAYVAELVKRGAVREEVGDHVLVANAVLYGFLCLPDSSPGEPRPSDGRIAELVSDTIERTMTTGRPLSGDDAGAVARATLDFLDAVEEIAQRRLAASIGGSKGSRSV
ncbi:TetR/AcrR family transcriptional regulator [Nonomuraea sp. NPDC049784]|uniref:TetR/AcrR family transcriptional regulator n=1 Tax=Nonomuraea sp. NPDC049784 TaxID=3154361 RepID=UPI0033FE04B3